jgi:anti-repressor protein
MSQLINIVKANENTLVDARDLHRKLERGTRFSTWIQRNIDRYEFRENEDYFIENERFPNLGSELKKQYGGQNKIDYFLTLDMAKQLIMLEPTDLGRKIRKYFISVEKQSQQLLLKIPKPIMVEGTHECLQYDFWLLQNGYSVSSGQFHRRIKKHPRNFYKGGNGKWYISREYATALLEFKECGKKLTDCAQLPAWEQTSLFN